MTKNIVGVNGIDPARQGIPINPIALSNKTDRGIFITIGEYPSRLIESLANRANAIRPYEIFRHRSQLIQNAMRVTLFVEITRKIHKK